MKRVFKILIGVLVLLGGAAALVLWINTQQIAVLDPKGHIAARQKDLFIDASLLMLIVVVPVFIMTLAFAWKYREKNTRAKYTPEWSHSHLAEGLWWGIPCVIIIVLGIITWKSSHELNPSSPLMTNKKPLVIQAVALDWKWLFIYPQQEIATVNFVQFPAHTPIRFEITSDAPMNSLWIPQLGGQIYAMAAMKTELNLIANELGNFKGCSANISGKGFAGMKFIAKASTQEEFDSWVKTVKRSSKQLTLESYQRLAKPSEYHPVELYALKQKDLFDQIIMKYITPPPGK